MSCPLVFEKTIKSLKDEVKGMSKTYYTYRSTAKHPLKVRFTCPICGTENVFEHSFETGASETYGGSASINKDILSQRLDYEAQSRTNDRAKELAEDFRHGRIAELINATDNPETFPIKCKKCGTAQIPSCCKDEKKFGTRQGCLTSFLGWIALIVAYIVSLILLHSGTAVAVLTLALIAGTVLLIVLRSRKEKKLNQLAAADPKLMKETFKAAFNDHMEVDFTEYGLGIVRVGEKKFFGKVEDIFAAEGIYFSPDAKQGEDNHWSISNEDPESLMIGVIIPVRIQLKDIETVDLSDIMRRGKQTCVRLTLKSGAVYTLDLKKEEKAQLALSQLTPLWQNVNQPV